MSNSSKRSILKGTLILTAAGFITRIIGFFYRILLSNSLGAEKMGIYQLVFPVYSICFTLFASGIQTSISRLVAAQIGKYGCIDKKNISRIMRVGLTCSLSIACTLSLLVFFNSDFIAQRLLSEAACGDLLKILALAFPFCGITSCINGYYYGTKKTGVPATTQLIEQCVRVIVVLLFASYAGNGDGKITCEIAVLGLVAGEITSNIFNILSMVLKKEDAKACEIRTPRTKHIFRELMKLAVPLTSNRLLISILNSVESVMIPIMLRSAGLSTSQALSIYGILTGMAMPFLMFPSAITNSFSVLLLPTISEAQANENNSMISKATALTIKYCLMIGILCTGIFITFGDALGVTIYNNKMAGNFIVILAWLCPFLYLTSTLGSVINGLGKAYITFVNSIVGLSIRILFVVFAIPKFGITGYLVGALISQLVISTLDLTAIVKNIKFKANLTDWVVKPGLITLALSIVSFELYSRLMITLPFNNAIILFGCVVGFCAVYLIILYLAKLFNIKEIKS